MFFKKNKLAHQKEWKLKTLNYARDINSFVKKGNELGYDEAGEEPEVPNRKKLIKSLISEIRKLNSEGNFKELRDLWPPAHNPLISIFEKQGQSINEVYFIEEHLFIASVDSKTFEIRDDIAVEIPNIYLFGRSPNRKYFGIANTDGVVIHDGWRGEKKSFCPWPKELQEPSPSKIIPFPCGTRVLMLSSDGIFVLDKNCSTRLDTLSSDLLEYALENPEEETEFYLSMEHGAVSVDGNLIAIGHQDSTHLVFDENLKLIGNIGTTSSYPHYAIFSSDNKTIAFNSCHFYEGDTLSVATELLKDLKTESYSEDKRTPTIEGYSRVYAGTSRKDEFIIGDANGYIRAFSVTGEFRWQQFIGSTVDSIDISPDGKTLLASTCAGFLSIFKLDVEKMAPHQIGTGNHCEIRRWIFWEDEPNPLIW